VSDSYVVPRAASPGFVVIVTGLVMLGLMSTSMYVPSLPSLSDQLDADPGLVKLTMTVFLVAFAVAQLFYGPLSDRYGRRPALSGGIIIFLAGTLICVFTPGIKVLVLGRFIQGVGACGAAAIARAIIRDRFEREDGARVMSYIALAIALGPAIGPIIGGELQVRYGWRAGFVFLASFAVVVGFAVFFGLPESNRHRDPSATDIRQILHNYGRLLRDRPYWGYMLIVGAQFGGVLAYTTGLPFVLIDQIGLRPDQAGYVFLFTVAGYFFGSLCATRLIGRVDSDRMIASGIWLQLAGGGLMTFLAFSAAPGIASVVLPMILFSIGFGIISPNALAGAMQPFPQIAGTASAFLGFFQMAFAGAATTLLAALYDETPRPLGMLILAMGVTAAIGFFAFVRPPASRR
jgi:DHA1 family bicyclomycin/chloramphenicol resistance-like MFS transporter